MTPVPPKKDVETVVVSSDASELHKAEKPDERVVGEIVGCLKMKSSMLAMGACERVKKIVRAYPVEVANSAILTELIAILLDGPCTPLGGSALQALALLALSPEGRQRVCMAGGAVPLIRFVSTADLARPNIDKAVTLLMNLAADQINRKSIRDEGGVEALVEVLKAAGPAEPILEQAVGGVHNLALCDTKAKARALEAGILHPVVRIVASKIAPDSVAVRARMLLTELLKLPGTDAQLAAVAAELGVRL